LLGEETKAARTTYFKLICFLWCFR